MPSYCAYIRVHPDDEYNRRYHDEEYGFPLADDNLLFERLVLEINQAGLSWLLILKKQPAFQRAFEGFDVARVAAYDGADVARLLADASIIRNRLSQAAMDDFVEESAQRLFRVYNGIWQDHSAVEDFSSALEIF
ncbi:MAG: DNA-3-methyladenine glycosylase I [Anaerolineales bacterium]|nr:DNA-3-methyladenine glycosylase I [Anaerolineales bacterium]